VEVRDGETIKEEASTSPEKDQAVPGIQTYFAMGSFFLIHPKLSGGVKMRSKNEKSMLY